MHPRGHSLEVVKKLKEGEEMYRKFTVKKYYDIEKEKHTMWTFSPPLTNYYTKS